MENEFTELPIEVKNRITSKANMAYGESKLPGVWAHVKANHGMTPVHWEVIKTEFIDKVEALEIRSYLDRERDKKALADLQAAYEEKLTAKEKAYQEIMRENARLITKLQNFHAPQK